MAVILYTPVCSNCKERVKVNLIRSFAREHGLQYIMRRTDYAMDFALQARNRSQLTPPLVYNEDTGKSVSFHTLTPDTLQELL